MVSQQKHRCFDMKAILAENNLDVSGEFWKERIERITPDEVERALSEQPGLYRLEKLAALVAPAAEDYLEQMARLSQKLTVRRFGKTIRLYAPLYLSNYCVNCCLYCGFNCEHKFNRVRLSVEQAVAEAGIIASEGFRDILLVSSEDRQFITVKYLAELAAKLRAKFSSISIEVYQMDTTQYGELFKAGIDGVTLYQETYDRDAYRCCHLHGPKCDYDNRLATPGYAAAAGMRQIGLGVLLGLKDWRVETLALAEHAHSLMKHYWQCHISFSFPRLRPAFGTSYGESQYRVTDRNLVQMITALRLCFADAGLVLSTREPAWLRDKLIKLGVTKMSAGSRTNPGGYSGQTKTVGQFEIDDRRSPSEVSGMLRRQGFEPVWKDWDAAFQIP